MISFVKQFRPPESTGWPDTNEDEKESYSACNEKLNR